MFMMHSERMVLTRLNMLILRMLHALELGPEVLMKLMSYQQGREIIQPGATRHDTTPTEIKKISDRNDARFDSLAIKVARLEEKHKMRRMKQKGRILDAKNEYLECLEALALSSSEKELTGEFLKKHGLIWKEVNFLKD